MTIQQQFRELARLLVTIEDTVPLMEAKGEPGMPVKAVDQFCTACRVTRLGAEVLASMVMQSNKVAVSACGQWIVSRVGVVEPELLMEVN